MKTMIQTEIIFISKWVSTWRHLLLFIWMRNTSCTFMRVRGEPMWYISFTRWFQTEFLWADGGQSVLYRGTPAARWPSSPQLLLFPAGSTSSTISFFLIFLRSVRRKMQLLPEPDWEEIIHRRRQSRERPEMKWRKRERKIDGRRHKHNVLLVHLKWKSNFQKELVQLKGGGGGRWGGWRKKANKKESPMTWWRGAAAERSWGPEERQRSSITSCSLLNFRQEQGEKEED